jgi:hypothetical protein
MATFVRVHWVEARKYSVSAVHVTITQKLLSIQVQVGRVPVELETEERWWKACIPSRDDGGKNFKTSETFYRRAAAIIGIHGDIGFAKVLEVQSSDFETCLYPSKLNKTVKAHRAHIFLPTGSSRSRYTETIALGTVGFAFFGTRGLRIRAR